MANTLKIFGIEHSGVSGFQAQDNNGNWLTYTLGGDPNPVAGDNDVIFIDFDGTIRYSYSSSDFANLNELPPNPVPVDNRMTATGWNWTLAEAKTYVSKYKRLVIGQTYTSTSGYIEIDVVLEKGRTSPCVGLRINKTISINWGDGSEETVITKSSEGNEYTTHNYASEGSYTILIKPGSGATAKIIGDDSKGSFLFCKSYSSSLEENRAYFNSVQAIRLPARNCIHSNYNFKYLGAKYITFPNSTITAPSGTMGRGITGCSRLHTVILGRTLKNSSGFIGDNNYVHWLSLPGNSTVTGLGYAYRSCKGLRRLSIPDSVTSFGAYAFQYMTGVTCLWFPENAASIGAGFNNLNGLKELHCTSETPPTASSAITLPSDCIIYVPYSEDHAVLTLYQEASNWSAYAEKMQEE